ncbi:hypothetical protein ACQPZX_13835 [Actinoplanes sp. CA-142083]|uniref:hypothetical protein n=1 Tax=Actinoplanes sp. CA-142083 TaxID=3239903 RepID=UPI003D8D577C
MGERSKLDGPRPGRPDERHGPAEEVAAQLRRAFGEAAIDEANRSRVVLRFESGVEASSQDRGERGVETF